MSLKDKILLVILIPFIIGSSIALMLLSYLIVPVFIVISIGSIIYFVLRVKGKLTP